MWALFGSWTDLLWPWRAILHQLVFHSLRDNNHERPPSYFRGINVVCSWDNSETKQPRQDAVTWEHLGRGGWRCSKLRQQKGARLLNRNGKVLGWTRVHPDLRRCAHLSACDVAVLNITRQVWVMHDRIRNLYGDWSTKVNPVSVDHLLDCCAQTWFFADFPRIQQQVEWWHNIRWRNRIVTSLFAEEKNGIFLGNEDNLSGYPWHDYLPLRCHFQRASFERYHCWTWRSEALLLLLELFLAYVLRAWDRPEVIRLRTWVLLWLHKLLRLYYRYCELCDAYSWLVTQDLGSVESTPSDKSCRWHEESRRWEASSSKRN